MKRIVSLCLAVLMCFGLLCFLAPASQADDSPIRKNGRKVTSASDLNVYDIVTFGMYPTRSYREYDDIRWIVLARNENTVTLLAKDVLDSCPYHRTDIRVAWPFSDLYGWLNETFLDTAFYEAEQSLISGEVTIPSVAEARSLPVDLMYPGFTGYAVSRGADSQQGIWWLRDMNREVTLTNGSQANVASVVQRGQIMEAAYRVTFRGKGVRPMLQVDFDRLVDYDASFQSDDVKALTLLKKGSRTLTSLEQIRLYDDVTFGSYPQASFGEDTPIHWIVIEKTNKKLKLLSQVALDYQRYQDPYGVMPWRYCSLNGWLNDSFRDAAFSLEEQSVLWTDVYLLSAEMAREIPVDLRTTVPSQYAISRGAQPSMCIWWLQDTRMVEVEPDRSVYCAFTVMEDGEIVDDYFSVSTTKGVRPVIEIDLTVPNP